VLKKKNSYLTIGLIEELVQRDALDIALRNGTEVNFGIKRSIIFIGRIS